MVDLAKITEQLEYIFLKKIVEGLKDFSIDVVQAKSLAKEFLKMEPFISLDDVKQKINSFVNTHSIFDRLKAYTDSYHEEQKINNVIEKMRKYIKDESNIDKALQIAKTE